MATATAKQPLIPLEVRIEATAMAIREEVMNYFKGTCVERLTEHNNVQRGGVRAGRLPYQYQRIDLERENPQMVYLNNLPLMTLRKLPDRLALNQGILKASPGLKHLHKSLDGFLKNYLVAVKVETDKTVFKGKLKPDEDLFTAMPRIRQEQEDIYITRPMAYWMEGDFSAVPQEYFEITNNPLPDDMPF